MIRWNWTPSKVCIVDIETASTVDLREQGGHYYAKSKSTRLLSAVFVVPGKKPIVWVPEPPKGLAYPGLVTGRVVPASVAALAKSHTWVAHNAEGFDALVWDALYPKTSPAWLDTLPLCKIAGLPGSIDDLGKLFGYGGKDPKGVAALNLLSRVKNEKRRPVGTPALWRTMLDYNVKDVEILGRVWQETKRGLELHAESLTLHSKINARGIPVDLDLARKLVRLWEQSKESAGDEVYKLTDGKLSSLMLRSVPAVHIWLRSQGIALDTLRREEVNAILADPDQLGEVEDEKIALVIEVLRQRSIATRTADAKIQRLINSVDAAGILRYPFVYHGAATGRWSSRGVQIHNLPKGELALDTETLIGSAMEMRQVRAAVKRTNKLLAAKKLPPTSEVDTLNTLTRPLFVADPGSTLGIIDFGAIEARCLAVMAGEESLLEIFSDPKQDVYCDMASGLFGRKITKDDKSERQVGKIIILASGYSMGFVRFAAFCKVSGIDLLPLARSAKKLLKGESLEAYRRKCREISQRNDGTLSPDAIDRLWYASICIETYRKRYPLIPKLWKSLEQACFSALRGKSTESGRCHFEKRKTGLVVTLPSGREITYRDAQIAKRVPAWSRMLRRPVEPQDCIIYAHPYGERTLYGGLITENLDQGISRDVLDDAMRRLDEAGYDIRLHVHDEAVFQDGDLVEAAKIMSTPPTWAEDFPVTVEGFDCPRYSKTPFQESQHVRAINGKTY